MNREDVKIIIKGLTFVLGVFLLAMCYNLFLLPNNFVTGGMNGLAIIFNKVFKLNPTIFIYVSRIFLLIISFIFLGVKKTMPTILGSLLYPLMVSFTEPIATYLIDYINVNEYLIIICMAGVLYGSSSALIYKTGFTTGGGDVIMQLIKKYFNVSTTTANFSYSFIILLFGLFVFGFENFIYAIIILLISNTIIDKITLGVSMSKVFFIYSKKLSEIKKIIADEYDSGVTILQTKQEYLHKKGEMLMVAVSNFDCYHLRNRILEIDPNAFFVINDCYEVNGGKKKERLL
ncbi:MAG: YitT family protein [bacterium]|nr:YitT family protein [bacterium]